MTSRLMGQETELAIQFQPKPGTSHPGNLYIFELFKEAIINQCKIRPASTFVDKIQFFVENGGAFTYECLPHALNGGLLEISTPECANPSELLLYQKTHEQIVIDSIPLIESKLSQNGFPGKLRFIKNCRDIKSNIYGAQENYQVSIANGTWLKLFRLGNYLSIPSAFILILTNLIILLIFVALFFCFLITQFSLAAISYILYICLHLILGLIPYLNIANSKFLEFFANLPGRFLQFFKQLANDKTHKVEVFLATIEGTLNYPLYLVFFSPFTLWTQFVCFRQYQKHLTSFLVSRPIISGAGTLLDDNTFALSEKATSTNSIIRSWPTFSSRSIFDTGNFLKDHIKAVKRLFLFRNSGFKQLMAQKQRLQIGLSDANKAQVAEYLKIGTTAIVLDMIDSGFLKSSIKLKDPITALKSINHDPTLKVKVLTKNQQKFSALEIQQDYLRQAQNYLQSQKDIPLEFYEIVSLWQETLSLLAKDPGKLIGRIDWVTKRYLLETSGLNQDYLIQKRIDIGYHELETGYFEELEHSDIAPILVSKDEIYRAIVAPPSTISAKLRSRLIKSLAYQGKKMTVSWNSVTIGGFRQAKVISLHKHD